MIFSTTSKTSSHFILPPPVTSVSWSKFAIIFDLFSMENSNLPEDHPIEWLDDARRNFSIEGSYPPFVTGKSNKQRTRSVVLASSDGTVPSVLVRTIITRRPWDSDHVFYTLDAHNERTIVAFDAGAHKWTEGGSFFCGSRYRR